MSHFPIKEYDRIVNETFAKVIELGIKKGGEYAGDVDRLANFRKGGEDLDLPMATIWQVYAKKHWDAITQWIKDDRKGTARERMEPIEGRVDDMITYLLLFKAILADRVPGYGRAEVLPGDLGPITVPTMALRSSAGNSKLPLEATSATAAAAFEAAVNAHLAAAGLEQPTADIYVRGHVQREDAYAAMGDHPAEDAYAPLAPGFGASQKEIPGVTVTNTPRAGEPADARRRVPREVKPWDQMDSTEKRAAIGESELADTWNLPDRNALGERE